MSTSMVPLPGSLSFWRVVDVPFEACVAGLDSWLRTGHGGELLFGGSQLLGPMEHDLGVGTRRIQVRLARGPLYPPLRMRGDRPLVLIVYRMELIPSRLVGLQTIISGAGRLLLDSLTRAVPASGAVGHAVNRVLTSTWRMGLLMMLRLAAFDAVRIGTGNACCGYRACRAGARPLSTARRRRPRPCDNGAVRCPSLPTRK